MFFSIKIDYYSKYNNKNILSDGEPTVRDSFSRRFWIQSLRSVNNSEYKYWYKNTQKYIQQKKRNQLNE